MKKKSGEVLTCSCSVDEDSIKRKIESLIDDRTMLYIHNLFAKTIDPWVPMLEGALHTSIQITSQYVRYYQPYAHYQYIGISKYGKPFNYTKDLHPLASSHWDEAAMQVKRDEFELEVKKILMARAKELYGD